ncbi:dienelactone hydrolase family protein [Streptomyces sp. JNUCC 64]
MNIMLFHSMYGLRPAVREAADRLRAAGHHVWTPDLFDGRAFDTEEEALAHRDEAGQDELLKRAVLAAAPYSDRGLVYLGLSLGAYYAQSLALGDERARGAVLLHSMSEVPEAARLDGLPVRLHLADPDPYEPEEWVDSWYLRMRAAGADVEVHRYRGAGHLYTDPGLPDHDAEAAELTWRSVLGFLESLDADADADSGSAGSGAEG